MVVVIAVEAAAATVAMTVGKAGVGVTHLPLRRIKVPEIERGNNCRHHGLGPNRIHLLGVVTRKEKLGAVPLIPVIVEAGIIVMMKVMVMSLVNGGKYSVHSNSNGISCS